MELNKVSGLTLNDYKKIFTGLPNDTNKILIAFIINSTDINTFSKFLDKTPPASPTNNSNKLTI